MSTVRMAVAVSGTRDGVEWPAPGELLDVPDDEAAGLVRAGIAIPIDDTPEPGADEAVEAAADGTEVESAAESPKVRRRG